MGDGLKIFPGVVLKPIRIYRRGNEFVFLYMAESKSKTQNLPMRQVIKTWWPLAASWLLMGAELPALSAVVARLAEPEINLAAYGGVVFPLALIIESPVIMLLAASTALSKDWGSYLKLRRFMITLGFSLTILHILIAFTPLYYLVVEGILGAPEEIVEPARIGLMIMTPWTWAIAYRRFNQGVLIRFGFSRSVGVGTVVRLLTDVAVLAAGYLVGGIPGIVVGSSAVAAGVILEAVYIGFAVRPVIWENLKPAPAVETPLTLPVFLQFYIPLALTSLLLLIAQPMGSAAMARMPQALSSLAVWPVVGGLVFMLRGLGMAYNEVVVALLDRPKASRNLRLFAYWLAGLTTLGLFLIAATPLARFWFEDVSALYPELSALARQAVWIGLLLPALTVFQSWFQGAIVHGRFTRGITEAVVVYLFVTGSILVLGVLHNRIPGIFVGMFALTTGMVVQNVWLWHRSRPALKKIEARDEGSSKVQVFKPAGD
jgi:hypothetical protein